MLATLSQEADLGDQWLERCRAGDATAWRELYNRHFSMVYRFALRMGLGNAEAEDVCQEVFVRAYRGFRTFRGDAQLSTWLYRVTANEVMRFGRRLKLRSTIAAALFRAERAPEPPPPDQRLLEEESFRELQAMLSRMKPKKRLALVLCELEELPLAEAARVAGCSVDTLGSRLRHAREEFARLCRQNRLREDRVTGSRGPR